MNNPFEKRATEYLKHEAAFLAVVSPEPVIHFLKRHAQSNRLYDRLVLMLGAPGSGKTTLARLFDFRSVCTLLQNSSVQSYGPIYAALSDCRAIYNETP